MADNHDQNLRQLKLIQQAEQIALALDKAIQKGEILDDDIEKAQDKLNKIYGSIKKYEGSLGKKFYILYEAQALIAWIGKDKAEAKKLLNTAIDVKESPRLLTESANVIKSSNVFVPNANANDPGYTMGIIGVVLAFTGAALIGLIVSIVAYNKSKSVGIKNGLAKVGIWLNIAFTIISLVISALALALPALQRSQRDTARKNDVSIVSAAITSYSSNSRGSFPDTAGLKSYATDLSENSQDSDGKPNITVNANTGAQVIRPDEGAIIVTQKSTCGESTASGQELKAGLTRQYTIVAKLESGSGAYYCQDN